MRRKRAAAMARRCRRDLIRARRFSCRGMLDDSSMVGFVLLERKSTGRSRERREIKIEQVVSRGKYSTVFPMIYRAPLLPLPRDQDSISRRQIVSQNNASCAIQAVPESPNLDVSEEKPTPSLSTSHRAVSQDISNIQNISAALPPKKKPHKGPT